MAFTEPFLFDRNITGGANLFRSEVRYIGQFTQQSTGGSADVRASRSATASPACSRTTATSACASPRSTRRITDPLVLARNPFLRDSLLIGANGERIISKVVPSLVYNTVDQPIFPTTGKRLTASIDLAGLGGNTNFYQADARRRSVPEAEQPDDARHARRRSSTSTRSAARSELPIFEKLFLGGEYSVRGFDLRTIGPSDPATGLVLGGNKSLLFNVEQIFTIVGPVRLILFYDAGQVRDDGDPFGFKEDVAVLSQPPFRF